MITEMEKMYCDMGISKEVYEFSENIIKGLKERFDKIDENAEYNQLKVIKAMQKNKVAEMHLSGTTGYGYNDEGRDTCRPFPHRGSACKTTDSVRNTCPQCSIII